MKRKFGFKPTPIKTSLAKDTELSRAASPPLTPITSTIDRRAFSPKILADLRQACAKVVLEVGPSGAEYDEILNQQDPLERYNNERNANKDYRSHNYNPQSSTLRNRKRSDSDIRPAPYVHVPANAARDFKTTVSGRSRSQSNNHEISFEPLEPTHTTVSGYSHTVRMIPNDPLAQIRATMETRPKTSAAACIDYNGPSADTSSSTSRTATTYDPVRPSTGVTSQALTPAHEKYFSQQRVSEQVLHDGVAASLADVTAKAWMAQELARRRGSETCTNFPPSRKASVANSHNARAESDRPRSRAGSIRSGIKDYIRPRGSSDSMRSFRSDSESRPASRGQDSSKPSNGSWWRGASAGLRRKGSWSSFRSARTDDGEGEGRSGKGRELNLNRSLPALPGLDQYVEKKEPKVHIAQLMARRTQPAEPAHESQLPISTSTSTKRSKIRLSIHTGGATVIDDDGLSRGLSAEEEAQRQSDLRRLVQEKMMHGSISPTSSSGGQSLGRMGSLGGSMVGSRERAKQGKAAEKAENEISEKSPTVATTTVDKKKVDELEHKNVTPKRKGGFKNRISRFLGSDKKMIAAD